MQLYNNKCPNIYFRLALSALLFMQECNRKSNKVDVRISIWFISWFSHREEGVYSPRSSISMRATFRKFTCTRRLRSLPRRSSSFLPQICIDLVRQSTASPWLNSHPDQGNLSFACFWLYLFLWLVTSQISRCIILYGTVSIKDLSNGNILFLRTNTKVLWYCVKSVLLLFRSV